MPSDVAAPELAPLATRIEAFRSALVSSAEELRGLSRGGGATHEERTAALAAELGPFADGVIDPARLAALLSDEDTVPPDAFAVVRRAAEVLEEVAAESPLPVRVDVPEGGDLRDAVRDALTRIGRVFGAARAADLARTGRYRAEEHDRYMEGLPFRVWTSGERALAPPVEVRVSGEDFRPAGLADFLDGRVALVVRVEGEAPPAALARLVTPHVLVVQATSPDELAPLERSAGPAVLALFDPDAAVVRFRHDPAVGGRPWERIELADGPEGLASLLERRWRRRDWREDLEHLVALAAPPEAPAAAVGETAEAGGSADPADRLAAWLLHSTDLNGA